VRVPIASTCNPLADARFFRRSSVTLHDGLRSAYAAFATEDSSRVTESDEATTGPVAVPVRDGVKYRTTVQEK